MTCINQIKKLHITCGSLDFLNLYDPSIIVLNQIEKLVKDDMTFFLLQTNPVTSNMQ